MPASKEARRVINYIIDRTNLNISWRHQFEVSNWSGSDSHKAALQLRTLREIENARTRESYPSDTFSPNKSCMANELTRHSVSSA